MMTAAALAALAAATPVLAEDAGAQWYRPTGYYGTLGYTGIDQGSPSDAHIGALTGRLGARFGRYFGVEGELSGGTNGDHTTAGLNSRLESQYAAYAVGFLPITPKAELFARVGYGESNLKFKGLGGYSDTSESLNYGAGGQYFFNGKDGIRAEYTRQEASGHLAPNADTASVSWVHRF
jgi:hypothetical protein